MPGSPPTSRTSRRRHRPSIQRTGADTTIKPGLGRRRAEDPTAAEVAVEPRRPARGRPPLHVWDRAATAPAPRRPTRTVSASWPPAPSTTPDASCPRARRRRRWRPGVALVVHPSDLGRIGVSDGGRRRARHQRARHGHAAGARRCRHRARNRVHARSPSGGPVGPTDLIDIDRAGHRARVETVRWANRAPRGRPIRCSSDGARHHGRPHHHRQDDRRVRAAAALGAHVHLVPAQGDRARCRTASGPTDAGPFGLLQTLADGIKLFFKEQSIPNTRRPPHLPLAPYLAVLPAFLAFRIVPIGGEVTIAGHQTFLQLADLPFGILLLLAMSGLGLYGVMLAGLVVGLEVPAARLGAGVGAAPELRGRVRSRDRRRAGAGEHALDARHREPAGLGRLRVDLQRGLVLAARRSSRW